MSQKSYTFFCVGHPQWYVPHNSVILDDRNRIFVLWVVRFWYKLQRFPILGSPAPLVHMERSDPWKKAYWPTASHILLWFYFWAKTVRKTNRIWLQTARARNLFLWFPLYIWCLLWCRQFLICSLNFGGVNRSYLVTDEHMDVFIVIRYNEEKETERINFTRKSRSNSLQRQKFSDNNFGNCSEVSML